MKNKFRFIYITNDTVSGAIAQRVGVDWILVDLEYRGKSIRQANRDTVISSHTLVDVGAMRQVISTSQLIVRINPWGDWSDREIAEVLSAGADIIMLPYFSTAAEVAAFIGTVNGRAKTCLLLETLAAIDALDNILAIPGIDFFHVGLNDLHIERGTKFMFEFLGDGGMDRVAKMLQAAGMEFGFGGIASIGQLIPRAEHILAEHFRLRSTGAILSRTFHNSITDSNLELFEANFNVEIANLRAEALRLTQADALFFEQNRLRVIEEINEVVQKISEIEI